MSISLNELLGKKPKQADLLGDSDKTKLPPIIELKKPKETNRDLLFGSGVTKRKAERAERDQEKLQQESFKIAKEHSEDLGEIVNLNLPDSLMDANLVLDKDQQAAIIGLEFEKYGCLIGQAGVGKTTTSKALINKLIKNIPTINLNSARLENNQINATDGEEYMNVAVCIVSFMGKAVQQIKRALPENYHNLCATIHSTLGYSPVMEEREHPETGEVYEVKVFRPQFTALNKLPFKLCVIDEAGSVPVYLFNELVAALPDDCRIILMGDLNQLPPVTGRSVLGFAITKWPTFVLSQIHRQADGNPIIENADRIIQGKKPLKDGKKFLIMELPDSAFEAFNHSIGIIQTLHKKGLFDPMNDAFIVPQNVDTLGQIAFNEKLVRYFNPIKKIDNIPINPPIVITAGWQHVTYAVGDKVMVLANDRDQGLTNGMIGVVKEIEPNGKFKGDAIADQVVSNIGMQDFSLDLSNLAEEIAEAEKTIEETDERERQASHTMYVKFQNVDDLIEFSSAGSFGKVTHSYAMTCHKSQGSEYDTVVLLVHSANLIMLSREWFYTAVTRAKERIVILSNHRGITHAVNRQLIKGKTIEEKAARFRALSKNDDTPMPILYEAEKVGEGK